MNISKESPDAHLNPFLSIWTKPRQTVRQIIEEQRSGLIFLLLVLSGYVSILTGALDTETNESFGIGVLLIGGLIISPVAAVIGNAVASVIYLLVGKMFKGTATYAEMFRAQLAGQIPQMWLIPLLLIWIFLSPTSYFTSPFEDYSGGDLVLNIILSVILFIVSICTLFVQSKAIGEAHGLSAWKGLAIIAIPILIIFIVALLFILAIIF